ncbi:MAG: M1 family metallopeptidase [Bacteroidia bacterium]|nr:M1 family metallopeptidase [Bacteroidia bacterium]
MCSIKQSILFLFFLLSLCAQAQNDLRYKKLQGGLSKLRKSFDVRSYCITLKVLPEKRSIEGINDITFKVIKPLKVLQLNLFDNLLISNIIFEGNTVSYTRDSNTLYVKLPRKLNKHDSAHVIIYYYGIPVLAKNAPWDGGFVWSKDSMGMPWIGLACEGIGASCWLPCKDHWSDEPEQVIMNLQVPTGLTGVSNGRLMSQRNLPNGYTEFQWMVTYSINHYNISVNIANYEHVQDLYLNPSYGNLTLDYYVLKGNGAAAKVHFQQTKRMLQAFEHYFGPYPFRNDGYKLVETPYWGMEHQSCIAYGNNYVNNKFGFDFIIIHESGHEWFANSLTANDKADMWLHESFTTYSEALYVEKQFGLGRAIPYLAGQKGNIKNELPLIGVRDIAYSRPDNDIYYKGAWILHTMRSMLDNDSLWFNTLYDLSMHFRYSVTTSREVEKFLIRRSGYNFSKFFDQYLYHAKLPVFEYYIEPKNGLNELHYRLVSNVSGLEMPVKVTLLKDNYDFVTAGKKWQIYDLPYSDAESFKIDLNRFLIGVKKIK